MSIALESNPIGLSAGQLERYREDGFLVVRGVFSSAEMSALASEVELLLQQRRDLIDTKTTSAPMSATFGINGILEKVRDRLLPRRRDSYRRQQTPDPR